MVLWYFENGGVHGSLKRVRGTLKRVMWYKRVVWYSEEGDVVL